MKKIIVLLLLTFCKISHANMIPGIPLNEAPGWMRGMQLGNELTRQSIDNRILQEQLIMLQQQRATQMQAIQQREEFIRHQQTNHSRHTRHHKPLYNKYHN